MEIRGNKVLKKIANNITENQLAIFLIIVAVLLRLMPHPANFAPIGAIALFGSFYLNKKTAIWLPLIAMITSDLIIGLHSTILFTWGGFVLISLLGIFLKKRKSVGKVLAGTIIGSFVFYFVTNFGVWAVTPLYEKTLQGLINCYVMAIPFFRNTVASDIFYVTMFFGAYELAKIYRNKTLCQTVNS